MYESFFNLTARPFDITPNPRFFFNSKKHKLALSLLEYSIVSQATIAVISGDIGAGKTTLLHSVLSKVPASATVCMISQTPKGLDEIILEAMANLDIACDARTPVERAQQFVRHVRSCGENGQRLILMVDEAQNLNMDALEGIRILTNVNTGGNVILQLILAGQPELLKNLQRPELRQLAQRVAVDFSLGALEESETLAYIGHRLAVAKGDDGIFPEDTRRAVHAATGGIPRLINTLCDIGLVYAYAEGQKHVSHDLMMSVIEDRRAGGILPLFPPAGERSKATGT